MKHIAILVRPLALVSVLFLSTPFLRSETVTTSPSDAYATAVKGYVESASNEVAALRNQVVATEKAGSNQKSAAARAELRRCEGLLEELKAAGPSKFDSVKLSYEQARADLTQKLADARQS